MLSQEESLEHHSQRTNAYNLTWREYDQQMHQVCCEYPMQWIRLVLFYILNMCKLECFWDLRPYSNLSCWIAARNFFFFFLVTADKKLTVLNQSASLERSCLRTLPITLKRGNRRETWCVCVDLAESLPQIHEYFPRGHLESWGLSSLDPRPWYTHDLGFWMRRVHWRWHRTWSLSPPLLSGSPLCNLPSLLSHELKKKKPPKLGKLNFEFHVSQAFRSPIAFVHRGRGV